jgi:hypothetical protein
MRHIGAIRCVFALPPTEFFLSMLARYTKRRFTGVIIYRLSNPQKRSACPGLFAKGVALIPQDSSCYTERH